MTRARLVTIGVSHFCEKARWALDWTGTPFDEEAHAPGLHLLAVRRAGGRTTPILELDGQVLTDSTEILGALDARAPGERKLYPKDDAQRREALALEDTFDEKLGPAVRRVMYHLLLPHRAPALQVMGAGVSAGERRALSFGFPVIRTVLRKAMKIDAAGAARSSAVIDRVFAEVAAKLADGRRYLVGGAFGAADLTFAALAAPALLPTGYGAPLPAVDDTPPEAAALVRRLRDTSAGEFALRLYREHRASVA